MATLNHQEEQATRSNHLHSKLNTEIRTKIEALEKEDLHEERFQVDRTQLDEMMMTFVKGKTSAELYFEQIMKTTQTQIEWQQPLTDDTSNKTHPFIRVSGKRFEDVTWAKGLILSSLEVRSSVCRLKMAIFNGDHLLIIGRNNNNINRIMAETQTNIQFPDPNLVRKENQVTIIGGLGDLDKARILIRQSSPIWMSFELPSNQPIPSPEEIGHYFKVHVMFSSSSKPNTLLATIRASNRRVDRIKKAARSLLKYAPEKMGNCTIVSVQLEVPPQYQELVKGENCQNITKIMNHTNTKIFFPHVSMRGYRRSQVNITGSIDEALLARAELVGYFPIVLTFDISAENGSASEIMELGKRAGVYITISHKERETGLSVTIKGAENSMDKIYEVHRGIRQINTSPYDKFNVANSLNIFDGFYPQDVDPEIVDLVEASETTSNDCVNEQSAVGETQDEIQQNNWMTYEPTYNQNEFGTIYHQEQPNVQQNINSNEGWIPSQVPAASNFNAYSQQQHTNFINHSQQPQLFYQPVPQHHQNNWIICELQGTEEVYNPSFEKAETQNAYFQQHSQSVQDVQNQQLNFEIHNSEPHFENAPQSPTIVNYSPLIIGSDESVAGKLICSGWGK